MFTYHLSCDKCQKKPRHSLINRLKKFVTRWWRQGRPQFLAIFEVRNRRNLAREKFQNQTGDIKPYKTIDISTGSSCRFLLRINILGFINIYQRLGELFKQMPKQTNNNPNGNNQFRTNSLCEEIDLNESESEEEEPSPKPKLEVAAL